MPIAIGKPYVLRKLDPACCDLQVTSHQSQDETIWFSATLAGALGSGFVSVTSMPGVAPGLATNGPGAGGAIGPPLSMTVPSSAVAAPIERRYLGTRWYIRSPTP